MSDKEIDHGLYREDEVPILGEDLKVDELAAAQQFIKEQEMVLAECFALIMQAGLLPELSRKARDYLSESEMINNFIQAGQGPNLEPRMTVDEYRTHLMQALEVPPAQFEFLNFIVKTCYLMIMAEKNPLVAQELRGVTMVSETLKGVLGR